MLTPQELAAQFPQFQRDPRLAAEFPQFAKQQPEAAFTWGAGGQRLTPEQLASQQAIAQGLMKSDYSPVGNWTQGLGRVADNLMGAIDAKALTKKQDANTAYSDSVAQALLGGGGSDAAARAMIDPYLSNDVQGLAKLQYQAANRPAPEPSQFERALAASGVMPGTPEYAASMGQYVKTQTDPIMSGVIGGQSVMGPQSWVMQQFSGGGGQTSTPGGGQIPAAAIADLRSNPASAAQFDEVFGAGSAARALGAK